MMPGDRSNKMHIEMSFASVPEGSKLVYIFILIDFF